MQSPGLVNQVKALYENEGIPLGVIADQLGLEEETVKMTLLQYSGEFRKHVKANKDTFTAEDVEIAADAMRRLLDFDDPNVQFKAAKFVINEAKGRHDAQKELGRVTVNVLQINKTMQAAKQALMRSKEKLVQGTDRPSVELQPA